MERTTKKRLGSAVNTYRPTIIELILDETGSMPKHATIAGYNSFLTEQKQVADGQCLMTLTKFDTSGLRTPFTDVDLKFVVPMDENTFNPGSMTNLRDAIGERVRNLEERLSSWSSKPNVLVIAMTDGGDNASRQYSEAQIKDLIKAHEAEGWTFVYLGDCPNALDVAARMGFQPGNCKEFRAENMEETMTTLSSATVAYRMQAAESATVTASTSYFA